MRERLTAAFVAITLLLVVAAGLVRAFSVQGELRERATGDVTVQARAIGEVLAVELAAGRTVQRAALEPFVLADTELVYASPGRDDVVLAAQDYDAEEESVTASVVTGEGTLVVRRNADAGVWLTWGSDWRGTLALFALMAVVAGCIGYGVARTLSAPFQRLAVAAAALGRGRFDLDLPQRGVPEALAISDALESSAGQLRDRLSREHEFGLYASHVLRTPLTSLRFHLEDLLADQELTEEARQSAIDCLKAVSRLDDAAGELVELAGRGVLVAGAAIPLRDLATGVAQRWADRLEPVGRPLTAAVEGNIELPFTPGPVEQVLDLLLDDVLAGEHSPVRLVFEGAPTRLRIDVIFGGATVAGETDPAAPRAEISPAALSAVQGMGGRLEQPPDALRLHLPRR